MLRSLIMFVVLPLVLVLAASANELEPAPEDVCQLIQHAMLANVEEGDNATATQLDIIMGLVCPVDNEPYDIEMDTRNHESALWCTGPAYHEPVCHSRKRQCCFYQRNAYPYNVYLRCKCLP